MIVIVRQRLRRRHHDTLARVNAQRVEILHVAHRYAVVICVADNLVLNLFPALERLLHQHLRRKSQSLGHKGAELLVVIAETAAETAQSISGTNTDRVTQTSGNGKSVVHSGNSLRTDGLDAYLGESLHKKLAVLGVYYGLHRSAEHIHTVALQNTAAVELNAAIQRRLAAERQQNALGTLARDDLLDKRRRHRQKINAVGHALRRLHRRYIGVDEHRLHTLLAHGLESLGTRIVELAGLADLQSAATQQ